MNTEYWYRKAKDCDETFDILKVTVTNEGEEKSSTYIASVDTQRSAELIVSELNSATTTKPDDLDLYEIYVYNSEDINEGCYAGKKAGEVGGWGIKWVLSTDDHIFNFPFFDEIITKNDNSTGRRIGAILFPS